MSFRLQLEKWAPLDRRLQYLEAKLAQRKERLRNLREAVSMVQSPVLDGMPKKPGMQDKVSAVVAKRVDTTRRLEQDIALLQEEIADVREQLVDIDLALRFLDPGERELLRMIFRDGLTYRAVALRMMVSKSKIYDRVQKAIAKVDEMLCPVAR